MRIASIINFWDCQELLPFVIENITPLVEGIVLVYSDYSNYNEFYDNTAFLKWLDPKAHIYRCEPLRTLQPMDNERRKRNFGLEKARELGFTHFLDQDADEFYEPEPFLKEKERFLNKELNGLCCACQVYFKSPILTIGLDTTIVPFIQKITPGLRHEFNRNYPYAFIDRGIRIDPTRQTSQTKGIEWSNIIMHHLSWYRKDINVKIRNSTARANIEASTLRQDYVLAREGYFVKYYNKVLSTASNLFNIPLDYGGELLQQDLLTGGKPLQAGNTTDKS